MTSSITSSISYESPIGRLTLLAHDGALVGLRLPEDRRTDPQPAPGQQEQAVLEAAQVQLDEYFAGRRRAFDLPLRPGGTPFQRAVWAELLRVPYGSTASYGAIAARVGRPRAVRAVGAANGSNPIAIIVPCHRVVGGDGSLTGYGGGLPAKRWLLAHEGGAVQLQLAPERAISG